MWLHRGAHPSRIHRSLHAAFPGVEKCPAGWPIRRQEPDPAVPDISKVMQAKKKRLECLTKNYMKGSQHKLEQLWNNYHSQRQKMTQQYSQQVSSALQQWETEAQRAEEQEEKLNNLFRQQQKVLQQARVVQNQKLKTVRELYEQFVKVKHSEFLEAAVTAALLRVWGFPVFVTFTLESTHTSCLWCTFGLCDPLSSVYWSLACDRFQANSTTRIFLVNGNNKLQR
uniref:Synaptonemal complex protein 3 n=1 Tax=Neolamprologus brichardi TaxID=32507 RepID=A0A3Q4MDI2_NEOBR